MLRDLAAYAAVLLLIAAAYPLAQVLLARSPIHDGRALTWTLAAALATGILTQIMLWMSLLGIRYTIAFIVLASIIMILGGAWVMGRYGVNGRQKWRPDAAVGAPFAASTSRYLSALGYAPRICLFSLVIVAAAVIFNAVYWPFTRDDVVALYHPFAQQMARDGALVPLDGVESLHRMYPMNVPLQLTFAYIAAGWDNEYLARLLPALLSVGCLPAAFALGRKLTGELTGWLAALLVAITPLYGSWASTGYTELPMALYLALGVVFALRLWERGAWVDAMLAGLCIGLATWTKNNALVAVLSLMLWFAWLLLYRRASWRALLVGLSACAAVGAPWYLRNVVEVGALFPDTAWVDQARRTLENLFVFITAPGSFGVSGWAMLPGVGWAVWQSWAVLRQTLLGMGGRAVARPYHRDGRTRNGASAPHDVSSEGNPIGHGSLAILLWIIPFFAAWWLLASYETRFLASILPLTCALGAAACVAGWQRLPPDARRIATPTLAAVALGLTLYSAYFIVEYKDDILRNPLMSHEQKMAVVDERRLNR
jgi:4-amino-4-deoxy-L-arabinose transferase-like glycosyltransferase